MIRRVVHTGITVAAVVATFLSASPWMRGYAEGALLSWLLVASIVPVLVPAVIARSARRSFAASGPASLLALGVLLLVVVQDPRGIGEGFADGVALLLSQTLPLGPAAELKVIPIVACWLVGAVVGESLARSRSPGAAVVPLFGGYVLAYAATTGGLSSGLPWSVALLLATGVLIFARRWELDQTVDLEPGSGAMGDEAAIGADATARYRPLAYGAVALVVTAVVTAGVVPRLPGMAAAAVRPDRIPPEEQEARRSPIGAVVEARRRAGGSTNDPELFAMTVDAPVPAYVALAELVDYDGQAWRIATTLQPTGGRVPGGLGTRPVHQDYEVLADLPGGGAWMPQVSRPDLVERVDVRFDQEQGLVVPVDRLLPGTGYAVRSDVPEGDLAAVAGPGRSRATALASGPSNGTLSAATRAEIGVWEESLRVPDPATGRGAAELVPGRDVAYLLGLVDRFEENYGRTEEDPARRAAAAAPRDASTTLTTPDGTATTVAVPTSAPEESDRLNSGGVSFAEVLAQIGGALSGTPEQFSTLFVLLARQQNVSARVVTGFRHAEPGPDGVARRPASLGPGRHVFRAADAWTWAEVETVDHGWVIVDPTPRESAIVKAEKAKNNDSGTTIPTTAAGPTTTIPPATVRLVAPSSIPVPKVATSTTEIPWRPVVAVVAILSLLSLVPLFRAERRRRRRRGAPTAQVIGAWHEALDTLDRARVAELDSLTATQVADAAAARFGDGAGRSAAALADVANTALFFPPGVGPEHAALAWSEVGNLQDEVRRAQGPWQRTLTLARVGRGVGGPTSH